MSYKYILAYENILNCGCYWLTVSLFKRLSLYLCLLQGDLRPPYRRQHIVHFAHWGTRRGIKNTTAKRATEQALSMKETT